MSAANAPLSLAAQTSPLPLRISVLVGGGRWFRNDIESPTPKRSSRILLAAQLDHATTGPLSLGLEGSVAASPGGCSGGCGSAGSGLDLSIRYRLVPSRVEVWPYALAGYGVLKQDGTYGRWHLGIGLDVPGPAKVGLRLEARYLRMPTARPQGGFAITVGPSVRF